MELTMEDGSAFRLRKRPPFVEESSSGVTSLLVSLFVISSEHNDRPRQTKKRRVKLKRLTRNMPMEGASAPAVVMARVK